jgi:hypothetical protein
MPRSFRHLPPIAACVLAGSVLAACSAAPPPAASSKADDAQATELRDTIQRPIQRAKAVEDIIQKSHDRQESQLQDEEGGNASSASQ